MLKVYNGVHTTYIQQLKSLQQTNRQTDNNKETVFVGLDGFVGNLKTYTPLTPLCVCVTGTRRSQQRTCLVVIKYLHDIPSPVATYCTSIYLTYSTN